MSEVIIKRYDYVKAITERDLEIENLIFERDGLRAENEKLRAYLGPNAVTYRVPGVTVIKIYDHAQSAAEAVRFGHETSYVSAALKETGDE